MSAVALKNLAEIERDGVAPEKIGGGTRYLGLEHIEPGGRILGSETVETGDLASTKFRFTPDHLLFGKLRPYLAKIALPDFAGICSTDILPVRPGPELDRRYLAFFLRQPSIVDLASSRVTGANLPRLSPKALGEIEIPWRPLPEQRRIATILEQADALRCLRRQSLSRLSDLGQAKFDEAFGKVQGTVPLEDAVKDTLIGLVRGAEEFGNEFAYPYVRMDAITRNGQFVPALVQKTNADRLELERYALVDGDLLFNTRNSRDLVGKTAIFRGMPGAVFNNNIMRIRFNQKWDPVFVEAYFRSRAGARELEKRKSGTTSVWAVYWSKLKSFPLPEVEYEKQLEFRRFIEATWIQEESLKVEQSKYEYLFASLQHRAFRGEL